MGDASFNIVMVFEEELLLLLNRIDCNKRSYAANSTRPVSDIRESFFILLLLLSFSLYSCSCSI